MATPSQRRVRNLALSSKMAGWKDVPGLLAAILASSRANETMLRRLFQGGTDSINYLDDTEEFVKEAERELYFRKTGIRLGSGDPIPAPASR